MVSLFGWLRGSKGEVDRRVTTYNLGPSPADKVNIPEHRPIGVGEGDRFIADRAAARLMRSSSQMLGKPVPAWVEELANAAAPHQATVRSDAPPTGSEGRSAPGVHAQRNDRQYNLWRDDTLDVWEHWPPPAEGRDARESLFLTVGQMVANMRSRTGEALLRIDLQSCAQAYIAWHKDRSPATLSRLRHSVRYLQAQDVIENSPEVQDVLSGPNPGKVLVDLGIPPEQVDSIPALMLHDLVSTFVAARHASSDPEAEVMQVELQRVLTATNHQLMIKPRHQHLSGLHLDLTDPISVVLPDSETSRHSH